MEFKSCEKRSRSQHRSLGWRAGKTEMDDPPRARQQVDDASPNAGSSSSSGSQSGCILYLISAVSEILYTCLWRWLSVARPTSPRGDGTGGALFWGTHTTVPRLYPTGGQGSRVHSR